VPSTPGFVAYRVVAGLVAAFCFVFGTLFVVAFLDRTLFQVLARPLFATDHWGYYILGFSGVALFAWGGCLVGAVRRPTASPGIANVTAGGLVLAAILRLLAWYAGEYRLAGDQLRVEAAVLVVLALGLVWLRPPDAADGPDAAS
jgi:hypothetical protein